MSIIKCKCGAMTNSALSEFSTRTSMGHDIADGCYAKWVNDHYEKGCLFDKVSVDDFMRVMAVKIIAGNKKKGG